MVSVSDIIREEIAKQGPIPFARFMALALYCPECGFYEKEKDRVGRGGDFYTSVSVGPLFGELLGFQLSLWFQEYQSRNPQLRAGVMRVVEAGAHDGRLASDCLNWLERMRPELFARTEYCIVEPSPRRRAWQHETLARFAGKVRWLGRVVENAAASEAFTLIFSNELLDAMPVSRLGWDVERHHWFEWGVTLEADRFRWARLHSSSIPDEISELSAHAELLALLPDGFTVEVCLEAEKWWAEAAGSIRQGKLLTFDYGFDSLNLILPERPSGTLRAYRNHQQVEDPLASPGEQDLTAHVNFARIELVGQAAGLKTEVSETQGQFLTRLATAAWKSESQFGEWDAKRTRQFQTLTHPEHLGRSFRVLVQSRGR